MTEHRDRDGDREIVLPTQEEFERAMYSCEGADNGDGEEDPAARACMEGMVRELLGEEEITIGDGEKVGPKDSDKKDLSPKNDKEEDGDVVKGEMTTSAAEIQEADEKGGTCPGKTDAVLDVKEGDGRSLSLEHGAGDPIVVEGQAERSLGEGGEARLATGDIECSKNGRDGAENSEMPMDDGEGNAEDSDKVKTAVDVEKPSSVAVECKNSDEGIVGNAQVKLEGATSGPGGEEEPVGVEIEAEAPVPEVEQEAPAPEAEGQAVAAAAINGQNGNEGIPQGQEEFPDFQTAKALKFGEVIRRLRI